jgi:hypothetical protein
MKIKKTPTNFKIYPNEMHLYMYIVPSKFNFLFDKCVYKWQYYKTVFLPKAQKMFVVGVTKLTVVSLLSKLFTPYITTMMLKSHRFKSY